MDGMCGANCPNSTRLDASSPDLCEVVMELRPLRDTSSSDAAMDVVPDSNEQILDMGKLDG